MGDGVPLALLAAKVVRVSLPTSALTLEQASFFAPIGPKRVEPVTGYEVVYADPPWAYNQRADTDSFRGGAMRHYSTMSTPEICALPIAELAAKNAMLFLWATFPCLPDAMQVIEAWGFEYCTCAFTWVKLNPKSNSPFFGVGYYTKSNAEICLLARRGKTALKPAVNTESQIIISPRMEHSRKPDEARQRIERMYPGCSRVELFARRQSPGWDVWGNQVESTVSLAFDPPPVRAEQDALWQEVAP